jgi:hypothetical protein
VVAVSEWRADDEVPGSAHGLGRLVDMKADRL